MLLESMDGPQKTNGVNPTGCQVTSSVPVICFAAGYRIGKKIGILPVACCIGLSISAVSGNQTTVL